MAQANDGGLSCVHRWEGTATKQECVRCGASCERDPRTGRIVSFVTKTMQALKPRRAA